MRELENFLNQILKPKIEHLGYKWNKSKRSFRKKTQNGFNSFTILAQNHSYDDITDIRISLTFCVRLDEIERIYTPYRNMAHPKYLKDVVTHCASWGQLHGNEAIGLTIDRVDVDNVSDKIFEIFINEAVPFFETHSTIEQLDKLYNDNSNKLEVSIKPQSHRITLGLILTKLTQRKDYLRLIEEYENELKTLVHKDYSSYYPKIFNKIVKELFG